MLGQEKADSWCDAPVTLMAPGTATGVKCDPRPRQRNAMAGTGWRVMSSGGNVPRTKEKSLGPFSLAGRPTLEDHIAIRWAILKKLIRKTQCSGSKASPCSASGAPRCLGLGLPESRSWPPITLPSSSEHLQIRDGSSEILRFPYPAYFRSLGTPSLFLGE